MLLWKSPIVFLALFLFQSHCWFSTSWLSGFETFLFDIPPSVFKLKSLLQLNFIGWEVGKCWHAAVRCTVVSSRDINIQSNYSFVVRWNYFSRFARCRCHVRSPSHMFMESSRFLAHLLSVVKVCIIWESRRSEELYPRSVAFPRIISIMVLTFGLIA